MIALKKTCNQKAFRIASHPKKQNLVASCGSYRRGIQSVQVYDWITNAEQWSHTVKGKAPMGAICFCDNQLAVGNQDGQLFVYSVETGELEFHHSWGALESIYCMVYSTSTKQLACSTWSGKIIMMDMVTRLVTPIVGDHLRTMVFNPIFSMCFFDNDRKLITVDDYGFVRIWSLQTRKCNFVIQACLSGDIVKTIDCFSDSFIYGCDDGSIWMCTQSISKPKCLVKRLEDKESMYSLTKLIWDGTFLLIVTRNGLICLFDLVKETMVFKKHVSIVNSGACVSCDEQCLFLQGVKNQTFVFALMKPCTSLDGDLQVKIVQ